MANTTIQLKKSSTPSAVPSNLANGELAINFADGKLFYKNTANYIVEFASGSGGNYFGTVNANNSLIVADTPGDILTLIAGSNIILTSDTINDTITISALSGSASVTTSDTAPGSPGDGDLWYNTDLLTLFIYYDDGSSGQWVEAVPSYIYTTAEGIAIAAFNKANNALANTAGITTAGDLNVSGNLTFDSVTFDEAAGITLTANGQLAWNANEHTLDLMMDTSGNTVIQQIGQETYYHVKNESGATISQGTPVMVAGSDPSGRILIVPAISNGTYPSQYVMGVTAQHIANNDTGLVTAFGKVRNLDTSAFIVGDILYADPATAGNLTTEIPTAPNNKTIVAFVTESDSTNGTIFVRPTYSSKLNDLGDVELASTLNNDMLVYVSANSRFENFAQTTLIPYLQANAAYNRANSAFAQANAAFVKANTANDIAVAAFTKANTGGSGATITIQADAVDATRYLLFANALSGNLSTANVDAGLTFNPSSNTLSVNGPFTAVSKSFVIEHPTKEGMMLRYGSLEGPENGVYVRGRLDGLSIIELPDYWWNLIDEKSITVNLTPIGKSQDLWVQSTCSRFIYLNQPAECFFTVFAERKDVDKLVVEY